MQTPIRIVHVCVSHVPYVIRIRPNVQVIWVPTILEFANCFVEHI